MIFGVDFNIFVRKIARPDFGLSLPSVQIGLQDDLLGIREPFLGGCSIKVEWFSGLNQLKRSQPE
jgi:hypothetical protein